MPIKDAKWTSVFLALSLAILIGWLFFQPAVHKQAKKTGSQPKLMLDRDFRDFGKVMVGETVSHHYIIRNTGTAPLVINKISTSCGCTVAKLDQTVLPPGTKATIDAELTVREGGNSHQVYLHSNDPDHPRKTLKLLAHGFDRVVLKPGGFYFTSLRLGATQTNIVRLSAGDGTPFKVIQTTLPKMEGLESMVEARPVNPTANGSTSRWEIVLTTTPRHYRWKKKNFSLGILTDHPDFLEHRINVFCSLRFPLQWIDDIPHFLGVAHPGESRRTELTLYSDDGAPFKILAARSLSDEAFQIKSEALEEEGHHRLTLTTTIPADATAGFRSTRFHISTDHPEAAFLEPSFSIHVLKR
ncbi:MAG: DUF1573 domain-containing protein [Verrucomicrobiota bacterium]|jgi:hypothetical protein|nr:DUF1573 domain-containing protein [Verrucomicrobiota bacterium]